MSTGLEPTAILNLRAGMVQIFCRKVDEMAAVRSLPIVPAAFALVSELLEPIESVQDGRKVSRVIARGAGSLNQRLAVVEAAARSRGIATRVQGLVLESSTSPLVAWPEFLIDDEWRSAEQLIDLARPDPVRELGVFDSRDDLFEQHLQGSRLARFITEARLSRRHT